MNVFSKTLTQCNFCGSIEVGVLGSALCREGSIKSEVWGSKERSSIQRYACGSCGKLWNERQAINNKFFKEIRNISLFKIVYGIHFDIHFVIIEFLLIHNDWLFLI